MATKSLKYNGPMGPQVDVVVPNISQDNFDSYQYKGKTCKEWNDIMENEEDANVLYKHVCNLLEIDPENLQSQSNQKMHKTVKKAFNKLALANHPDKNRGRPEAGTVFTMINKANELLKTFIDTDFKFTSDADIRARENQLGEKLRQQREEMKQGGNNNPSRQSKQAVFNDVDEPEPQEALPPTPNEAPYRAGVINEDDPRYQVVLLLVSEQIRLMDKYHLDAKKTSDGGVVEEFEVKKNKNGNPYYKEGNKTLQIASERMKAIAALARKLENSLKKYPGLDPTMDSLILYSDLKSLRDQMKATGALRLFVTGRNKISRAMEIAKSVIDEQKTGFLQNIKSHFRLSK